MGNTYNNTGELYVLPYVRNIVTTAIEGVTDPYFNNVSLLIKGESDLLDTKGKTVTVNGDTALSPTQAKFGTNSIYFDGTGDYLSLASSSDFGFGTEDFTIEGWFYNTGSSGVDYLLDFRTVSSSAAIYLAIHNGANLMIRNGSGGDIIYVSAVTTNTWFHLAAVRSGGTLYAYVNGVMVQSQAYTTNLPSSPINIGANLSGASNYSGYMEQIRITKGVARYTEAFTPPTTAFGA